MGLIGLTASPYCLQAAQQRRDEYAALGDENHSHANGSNSRGPVATAAGAAASRWPAAAAEASAEPAAVAVCDRCLQPVDQAMFEANLQRLAVNSLPLELPPSDVWKDVSFLGGSPVHLLRNVQTAARA